MTQGSPLVRVCLFGLVGSGGNSFSGTYVADIVLPSGQIDPSQHVTGLILATRLTLD